MEKINQMVTDILKKEGGFVNHPNDKGGPTNYGITIGALSDWTNQKATIEDVKSLDIKVAKVIYKNIYLKKPKINLLPEEIQPIVFDSSVNHGPKRAIKFVQTVLSLAGFSKDNIHIDGIIGPKTIDLSVEAVFAMRNYFVNAIVDERIIFYNKIVQNNPSQSVFLQGWLGRAESFRLEV